MIRKYRRKTTADLHRVLTLYRAGYGYGKIATITGYSLSTIRQWVRDHVPAGERHGPGRIPNPKEE